MNTNRLKHCLVLTDTLHVGRVGNISISALSRKPAPSNRQLEDELGALLFVRDNRSVSMTSRLLMS
jgi:LysR family positive regulator for ilvC